MQAMNNAGVVHSEKGIKGGYALDKKLSEVSYLELFKLLIRKVTMMSSAKVIKDFVSLFQLQHY